MSCLQSLEHKYLFKLDFRVLVTKRKHNLRELIFLMIFIFELSQFINNGENENQYLYLRRKLNWGIIDYTTYTIVIGVFGMVSNFIIIPLLSEKLQLRDSVIAIIDITGHIIQTILFSIATSTWMVYLGIFVATKFVI